VRGVVVDGEGDEVGVRNGGLGLDPGGHGDAGLGAGVAERRMLPGGPGEDGQTAGRQPAQQLTLLVGNRLQRAEALEVRRSDERDQRVVGLDHRGKRAHLAGQADAGLDDGLAGDARLEAREGKRDAEEIVEVALGRQDRGRIAQQAREEVLRRGLAGAAGDADHLRAGAAPVEPRDVLQLGKRIGDDKLRQLDPSDRAVQPARDKAPEAAQQRGKCARLRFSVRSAPRICPERTVRESGCNRGEFGGTRSASVGHAAVGLWRKTEAR
jgi:hypothetical protein